MSKTGVLGSFEELVLLAVLQTGAGAYAVSIRRELAERSGSDVAMGAVYATLDRLAEKGLVRSELETPATARAGGRRRFYEVTPAGVAALVETRRTREALWRGLSIAPVADSGK